MKEFIKEWGLVILFLIVATPVALYFTNSNFALDVNRAIDKPPYVSISFDTLVITDFKYSVGLTGFNAVDGDFDRLNSKIYQTLSGKTGLFKVAIKSSNKDRYGNEVEETTVYGTIDAELVNQYKSEDYWVKDGGISKVILESDSIKTLTIDDPLKDQLHKDPKPITSSNSISTYIYEDLLNKTWGYYQIVNGEAIEITPEDDRYVGELSDWNSFKQELRRIRVKAYSDKATVTVSRNTGDSDFNLSLREQGLYTTETGNSMISFHISPEGRGIISFQMGDRMLALFN